MPPTRRGRDEPAGSFAGRRILVAEDEYLAAHEIVAEVVPALTVAEVPALAAHRRSARPCSTCHDLRTARRRTIRTACGASSAAPASE